MNLFVYVLALSHLTSLLWQHRLAPLLFWAFMLSHNYTCIWILSQLKLNSVLAVQVSDPLIATVPIWAKDEKDCWLLVIETVHLTSAPPPMTKQYPISREAIQRIR